MAPRDVFGRPLTSLRISVTDRCNIRCRYCMPEAEYTWLPRASILTFEEIDRLAGIFAGLGVRKLRLTGGEPLLRQKVDLLVALLARQPELTDLALTTNGILLARQAQALKQAGLKRVTVSLDTLRSERFHRFTRSARHADVLAGIAAARGAGFTGTKVNAVVIRGFNDDELVDLLEFGKANEVEVRFIEYMDVGGATQWRLGDVVPRQEMLQRIGGRYGAATPLDRGPRASAPAERFALPDGTAFGIIASTTEPFCGTCDRSRLTADGMWLLCLYAETGTNLRDLLRAGAGGDEIAGRVRVAWEARTDRGAEERLGVSARAPLYQIESLRADPHREMHTRGG